jgi:hypothetical protein
MLAGRCCHCGPDPQSSLCVHSPVGLAAGDLRQGLMRHRRKLALPGPVDLRCRRGLGAVELTASWPEGQLSVQTLARESVARGAWWRLRHQHALTPRRPGRRRRSKSALPEIACRERHIRSAQHVVHHACRAGGRDGLFGGSIPGLAQRRTGAINACAPERRKQRLTARSVSRKKVRPGRQPGPMGHSMREPRKSLDCGSSPQ